MMMVNSVRINSNLFRLGEFSLDLIHQFFFSISNNKDYMTHKIEFIVKKKEFPIK